MQPNFRLLFLIGITFFTLASCKKESSVGDNSTEITTHSDDQSRVSGDMDEVTSDINVALEADATFSGRQMDVQGICGATAVADTMSNPWKITITYNGANCHSTATRTGTVVVSMPSGTRWKNAGATLTVTYQNLKITRLADSKSITINGSHTLTNVSGGLLINLPNLTSITHTIESNNMSITFDDNTQRTWKVARKRVFTYSGGVVLTITGNHTDGNMTGIAEWGTNRFGHAFTTTISEPLVIRQDCAFRLTSGQITHQGFTTASATFGLDASGSPTSCPGTGHYYYKLSWTGIGGNTHNLLFPY